MPIVTNVLTQLVKDALMANSSLAIANLVLPLVLVQNTLKTDSARLAQHISPIVTLVTPQPVKVALMANSSLVTENLVLPLVLPLNTPKMEFAQVIFDF